MKVETKETSTSTYTLTVEVPAKVVGQKVQQVLRDVAHQVNMPGFRPGKVPRSLLEMQFGENFLDGDVQTALIEENLPIALDQESLRPLSRPETRVVDYKEGKDFTFEADIEVLPKIEFPEFSTIKVEVDADPEPTDEDVERVLDDLKTQHATLVPKTGEDTAAIDDVLIVELGEGDTREILLSEGSDLAEQLVGHKVGEEVTIKLEEQDFTLNLKELKSMDKPDLDELADVLDKEDSKELVDEIHAQLQERLDQEYENKTRYQVLDAIIESVDVPVPPRLKEEVIDHEIEALQRSGRVGTVSDDDRTAYAEGAEQRLQREVALESLKRSQPELKLDDEKFEEIIKEEAALRSLNPAKFKALLERENSLQRFRSQKEDEQVLDFLMDAVKVSKAKAKKTAKPKTEDAEAEGEAKAAEKNPAAKKKPAAKKTAAKTTTAKKATTKKAATTKKTSTESKAKSTESKKE